MKTLKERFEAKVIIPPGFMGQCWGWSGTKLSHGYGMIHVNSRMQLAHRVSYELYVDPIPEGLCISHTCDNPSCTNPLHLYPRTHQENMADRDTKGRGFSKIARADAETIRVMYSSDQYTQKSLGKIFGLSQQHVGDIVNGKRWV